MEHLWAPWRMEYLLSSTDPGGCIFCLKPTEERDEENAILYRARFSFVILNAYPYNPGHLMVVPYEHAGSLTTLQPETAQEIMDLTRESLNILNRAMSPDGMNIGVNEGRAAGAGIADHIHQHVVPRWAGDTNFMTSVGETKVLPELVRDSYRKLQPLFARLDSRR